ncbi:alpha/beta hydrolase [Roseibium sp. FZY0029]|uniref:alpha/beta hydrolase n=1 Tax=Roseibium sp. FZY0029 TaxID=3116647 RepID=UPI002EBC5BE6|nr:alpha/beta hydrolase [Roseibium sp. FZY0029]
MNRQGFDTATAAQVAGTSPLAIPIAFDGLAGYFHPASGSTAILLLSPWGYEELCSRKSYRMLGEKLAASGYPCLRFDYPATANSHGDSAELEDKSAWRKSVTQALAELRRLVNPERVVMIGQGIGAGLAATLAEGGEVAGQVLLAPVAQGRAYLRELAAWTAMTQPTFMVKASDGPKGGLMAGGFVLSAATVDEVKSINLFKAQLPSGLKTLLVERSGHPGDQKLADHFTEMGLAVETLPFEGYADYVSDPTLSVPPLQTLERIVTWMKASFPAGQLQTAPVAEGTAVSEPLPDVVEEALRFGPDKMFFGVLTTPLGKETKTAVVILNSGYDHSIGWARMSVGFARSLAEYGCAVLRMDLAGIGESSYWPNQPAQVLYSDKQLDDVRAAVGFVKERTGAETVILFGRCSGAYLALVAASDDERVEGAFLVNSRRLVWDPDEDVDKAIREPIQTLSSYGRKAIDLNTLKLVVSGDINLVSALKKVTRAAKLKAGRKLAPVLGSLSRHQRLFKVLTRRLKHLEQRGVPLCLVYSDNDRGLLELHNWFGPDRRGLKDYPNIRVEALPDADHNLTPITARKHMFALLKDFVVEVPRSKSSK